VLWRRGGSDGNCPSRRRGTYNIVDDQLLSFESGAGFRQLAGCAAASRITEGRRWAWPARRRVLREHGLRGASNAKARGEFGFSPRRLAWLGAAAQR